MSALGAWKYCCDFSVEIIAFTFNSSEAICILEVKALGAKATLN